MTGNESVAGHGIRRWQEMDVDPSTKRIIPTKYISKTGIILYKWVLLVDYYTHVMDGWNGMNRALTIRCFDNNQQHHRQGD
jgi:hypothetical protein